MVVARDEGRTLTVRERYEVIVSWVGRSHWRQVIRVFSEASGAREPCEDASGLVCLDSLAQLWVRERSLEFGQKRARHDEFEPSLLPSIDQASGGAFRREKRGDDDVGIENGAQLRGPVLPGCVLCLDGEPGRLFFREVVASPELLQEVESQIPTEGPLDHRTIALARARGPDLDGSQDLFIDRERRPHLRHKSIIASRCDFPS